jgi:hypothetical protein
MIKANKSKSNRRMAFRIYQRANLFYCKIDRSQDIQTPQDIEPMSSMLHLSQGEAKSGGMTDESSFEAWLPASESLENDTLNVNISTSGLSFTCKEPLQAGDYLLTRILLLADMTNITCCCKVVYCKPSNPYENDRYPYLIGARFMNLAIDDRNVLDGFLEKRRKQQFILNGLLLLAAIICLAVPDQVLDYLLTLAHYLLGTILHLLHLLFEYLESALDHIVEHLFHTGLHQTQIIVFYTLLAFATVGLYGLWLIVPPICLRFSQTLREHYSRKKASLFYYWGEQTLQTKVGIVLLGVVSTICYAYFGV